MKQQSGTATEPPAGFERIWVDDLCTTVILVPVSVAQDRAQAARHRREQEHASRLADHERQQQDLMARKQHDRRAEEAKARLLRKTLRSEPRAGWFRVLPGLEELGREVTEPGSMTRSADREVNERRKQIVQQLLARGPDRKVAMPVQWRHSIDELESVLPHFRQPIRSLRNALALAEATGTPPRIAPQLLLGPPGVGKTLYSHKVADLLGTARASVQFDQPSAGAQLRGSDKYWSNSEPGLLFNLICQGDTANPVVLLDEIDKSCVGGHRHGADQLAQLHGALERETARCIRDISVDIEFDASLVTYIATANSLAGLGAPVASRMDVHAIEAPGKWEAASIANAIAGGALRNLGLEGRIKFDRRALHLLAHLSPRLMVRAAEQAIAAAVTDERSRISEDELWRELGGGAEVPTH